MRIIAFLLVIPLLAGCLSGDDPMEDTTPSTTDVTDDTAFEEPVPESPAPVISFSKIHTPAEIVDWIDDIASRPGVTSRVIGDSIEGRPIHLVSVGTGGFDLWIQGRIHGNEPTGGEAIMLALDALTLDDARVPAEAPESFKQFRALRDVLMERITFHFIPVANPDGAAAYTRGNFAGVDLNREFFLFTQPEPVHIMEAFWDVKPDGCLDLHNEGIGSTDWDAFNPDGPLLEPELRALMMEDIWYGLLEVDAAGGSGGGPNEFYNIVNDAPVVGDVINPTAFHPGTHDMFCTTRGAPGYTPEGAIAGGFNGVDDDIHSWSTRLHQVTIVAAAFHWAGFYGPETVEVHKIEKGESHDLTLSDDQVALSQFVFRQQEAINDYSTAFAPYGSRAMTLSNMRDEGTPTSPFVWADTVYIDGGTDYSLSLEPDAMGDWEGRSVVRTPVDDLVTVTRSGDDLQIVAHSDLRLHLTDSYDPVELNAADFSPVATSAMTHIGTVDERGIVTWRLDLDAGESVTFSAPVDRDGVGPYRFTAISDAGDVHMGVERVRNAPAGAQQEVPQEF